MSSTLCEEYEDYEEGTTYPEQLSVTTETSVAYWAPTACSPPLAKDHPHVMINSKDPGLCPIVCYQLHI
eukprot:1074425-Amphidinium_carterae.1